MKLPRIIRVWMRKYSRERRFRLKMMRKVCKYVIETNGHCDVLSARRALGLTPKPAH